MAEKFYRLGCDIGGTFTDFHCLNELTGEAFVHKAPSTPDNPARAIVTGVEAVGWIGIGAPAKTPPAIVAMLAFVSSALLMKPRASSKFLASSGVTT